LHDSTVSQRGRRSVESHLGGRPILAAAGF
jgi:hypothetical protein